MAEPNQLQALAQQLRVLAQENDLVRARVRQVIGQTLEMWSGSPPAALSALSEQLLDRDSSSNYLHDLATFLTQAAQAYEEADQALVRGLGLE